MSSSPSPKPAPPPPMIEDPSIEEARKKELALAQRQRGRAATLLTNAETLGAAPVARKTLLGQ